MLVINKNNRKNSFPALALVLMLCCSILSGGCSKDFLKPDPLSFYEPITTFSTISGLNSAMAAADRHLRTYWAAEGNNQYHIPIQTEYLFTDVASYCKTDVSETNPEFDVVNSLTPVSGAGIMSTGDGNTIGFFWSSLEYGIKYANTIIQFVDAVEGLDEATKNVYKGRAYFHRSFRYLSLVFQFGDIPLITKILEVPKQNYRSTKKEAILDMITRDMEFAVQWVPEQQDMDYVGMINKGACRMLLIKCYLATGQWQKAKEQADILIDQSGYSLMLDNFGTWYPGGEPGTWPITRNVIWDLHRTENKLIADNKETILGFVNQGSTTETLIGFHPNFLFLPVWYNGALRTPDGYIACESYPRNNANYRADLDYIRAVGRGGGFLRLTGFAQNALWKMNGADDKEDLRHNSTVGNWVRMDSIKYNPAASAYRGQKFTKYHPETGALLHPDTLRGWFDFPLYKIFMHDPVLEADMGYIYYQGAFRDGANANWCVYRLAEAYLLRAEAKFYLGDPTAKDDVNEVRKRAKCSQLYTSDVTIGDIMDERARELYLEEWRNVELSRVSYCLALSGKPDEWGNTYDINTFDKQSGMDMNGGSYWYQRVMHHSDVFNKGPIDSNNRTFTFRISKHNFYWPIPDASITANNKGTLSQNYGYDGYDPNTPKWETWQEAVADEDRID